MVPSIAGGTAATFTIASVQGSDAANYDVVLTNIVGSVTSGTAALVLNTPVSLTTQPVGASVNPGLPFNLSVSATGTAPISYQWRKNGTPIVGATAATLSISAALGADAGSYDVVVRNVVGSVVSDAAVLVVNTPVAITVQPVGTAVNPGATARLSVTATGAQPIAYQWRRGGVPVAGGTSATLELVSVQAEQAGSYDVLLTNVLGTATSSAATVALNTPVTITTQPVGATLRLGSSLVLEVAAAGTAPITYQWRKDGVAIVGATRATHHINSAKVVDAGSYDVVVTNVTGDVTSGPAVVAVDTPVTITTPPAALSVNPGAPATFSVVAAGTPPLTYQWRRGGVEIAGGTAASYTIPAVQASDAWTYDVVVTNPQGSAISAGAALSVNVPVTITKQPVGAAVLNLAPVRLSVTATGTAPLSYQWRKDSVAIVGGTGATLALDAAQLSDAGSYDVQVRNAVGEVLSAAAVLSVHTPVSITGQPTDATLDEGTAATLSVTASGSAPLSYHWRKDGVALAGGTAATYLIPAVRSVDGGSYDVVVSNPASSSTSAVARLVVNALPVITAPPVSLTVIAGVTARFSVTATGAAPLRYQWFKGGGAISGGTGSTLVLSPVTPSDEASYSVEVSNALGRVTSGSAALSLTAGPVITQQPVAVAANPGKSARFTVTAEGASNAGTVTFQWRRNGALIAGATGSSYSIASAGTSHVGMYDVLAKNGSGSMLSVAVPLTLNAAVAIKTGPAAVAVNPGGSTTLSVVASGTEPLTYQWRRAGVAVAGAKQSTFTIASAQASNVGSYDVVVGNMVNTVTSKAAVVSLNAPVRIKTQPASGAVNPGASRTLSVAASGTAPITYQWRRAGQPIPGATSATYTISGAGLHNVGSYDVALTNVVGTVVSNAASVTLNTPVTILSQPADVRVSPGKSVAFSVTAAGTAPLTYQWRRNGVAIASATAGSYTITSAQLSHSGTYDVLVGNAVGRVASKPAVLTLNTPVSITKQPAAIVANPWAPAQLSVTASGTAPLTYQWRKGGVAIPGATSSTYALAALEARDAGTYDVVVGNVVGSVISAAAKITLNTAVSIVSQPMNVSLNTGASKALSVVATGTAPLRYQWRKNSVDIAGATGASYTIAAAKDSDAGLYDVTVSNDVGTVSSNSAVVTLNTPVSIVDAPVGATLNPGAALSLGVSAAGTAPLTYQWRRNGLAISGATGSSYAVPSVAVGNAGSYDVVVSNVAGSVVTTPVTVAVNAAVTFTAQPASGAVNPGSSRTLSVEVGGTGPFTYQWRKGGVAIAGATEAGYTIDAASASDVGAYDVVVRNVVGPATSQSASISLNVPVSIVTQPLGASLNPGTTRTLTVVASGTGPLTYQWRKNGATLAGATSTSYALGAVQAASAGSYDVIVRNVVGSVTSNAAVVVVHSPVVLTTQPSALTVNAGDPATLSVVATGSAPLTYQWRKNGVSITGGTSASHTVREALAGDGASYSVVVGNMVGSVTSANAVLTVNPTVTKTLYKFIAGTYTWAQAKADAEARGGHLATVTTAAEWSAVLLQLGTNASRVQWLGGSQSEGAAEPAGGWQWVTGEAFDYTRWGATQPDNAGGTQRYLVLNGTGLAAGTWNDADLAGGGSVAGYLLEQEPVAITAQPASQAVAIGDAVTLEVVATGAGPLTYQWRRNGTAISGGTSATYKFSNAQSANTGVYDVVVTNPCGSLTSTAAAVSVNVPVSITAQPVSVLANPGAPVRLAVTAAGSAPITYQWRKNGEVLAGGTSAIYAFASVQAGDAGEYDVAVSNVCGSVQSGTANVVLNTPLTVTSQPQGAVLNPGGKVTLQVGVSGTMPASYQWRRDGVQISGATGDTYTVVSTQITGPTAFDVVATNVVGSVFSEVAVVSATTPPSILEQPVSLAVNPGAEAVFRVVAGGTAPHIYQWRRNGVAISGGTGAQFALPNVQAASAGNFDVVVGNAAGSATSAVAVLSVNVPVSLSAQPVGAALNAGGTLSLSVTAAGTAPLTYQWFRNGEPVAGATARTLTLTGVKESDAGSYQAVVSNVVGSVSSSLAQVTINTPPVVVQQPLALQVNPGEAVSFSVSASGTGPLSYQWRRNGVAISGATASVYSLAAAQSTAVGSYDVVVKNLAGSVTSEAATLALNAALRFTSQPIALALNPGGTGMLSVAVEGTVPVTYQWRKNGTAIEGATGAAHTVRSASDADAGSYDVVVGNVVGSLTSNKAQVALNTPVRIAQEPVSLAVNPGAQAVLSVVAVGTAPVAYQWSKDGVPVAGATSERLVLAGVQAVDAGSYAVVVSNVAGTATSGAAMLTVNTPVSISTQPKGMQLLPGGTLMLSVAAAGSAPLNYQWYKNGAPVTGATTDSFTISKAGAGDAATYSVVVGNSVGSVPSDPAVVSVAEGVRITRQPASQTSLVGLTTTLSVAAAGTGPLSYQWRKGGDELPGQTGASLVLSALKLVDSGSYDVVVGNLVDKVTSGSATVLVQDPPVLGAPPQDATVKAGGTVSFRTTVVKGDGTLTYQWRKDGTPIPGANALVYEIPFVDGSHGGFYDLVVTGPWGSVVSAPARLTVEAISTGKPVVMSHPVNATVLWGKSATLSAMVASSLPFKYEWVKMGKPEEVVSSGTSAAGTGLVLKYTVAAVKTANEGLYQLVLRTEDGALSEETRPAAIRLNLSLGEARLTLKGWTYDLSPLQTDLLSSVVLPMSIAPNEVLRLGIKTASAATYAWQYRSGNGTVTRLSSQTGPNLNFAEVIRLKGFYIVTITTGGTSRSITFQALSFATSAAAVSGLTPPVISYAPESLVVPQGASAGFTVSATGSVGGYRWFKRVGGVDVEVLAAGSSPWLIIDKVASTDETEYSVEVLSAVPGGASATSKSASLTVVPTGD
jgi:hypothetical protein